MRIATKVIGILSGSVTAAMIATPAMAYTVQPGDTLSEVAAQHGTSVQQLADLNNLVDPDVLSVGQHLNTGGSASSHTPAVEPKAAPVQTPKIEAPSGGDSARSEIIRRESTGNPNAVNGKYHGLYQTDQAWGTGSVAEQNAGAEQYMKSRYGSWDSALAFHNSNGWW